MNLLIISLTAFISLQPTRSVDQNFFYYQRTNHPDILTTASDHATIAHSDINLLNSNYQRLHRSAEVDNTPTPVASTPLASPQPVLATQPQQQQQNHNFQPLLAPVHPPTNYYYNTFAGTTFALPNQPASLYDNIIAPQQLASLPQPIVFQQAAPSLTPLPVVHPQPIPLPIQQLLHRSTISDAQGFFEIRQPTVTGYAYSIGSNDKIVATSSFTLGSSKHDPSFGRFKFLGQRPLENYENPYANHLFQFKPIPIQPILVPVQTPSPSPAPAEPVVTEEKATPAPSTDNINGEDQTKEEKVPDPVEEKVPDPVEDKVPDPIEEKIPDPVEETVPVVEENGVPDVVEEKDVPEVTEQKTEEKIPETGEEKETPAISEDKVPVVEEKIPEVDDEKIPEVPEEKAPDVEDKLPEVVEEKIQELPEEKAADDEKIVEPVEDKVPDVSDEKVSEAEKVEEVPTAVEADKTPKPESEEAPAVSEEKVTESEAPVSDIADAVGQSTNNENSNGTGASEEAIPDDQILTPDSGRVRGVPTVGVSSPTLSTKPVDTLKGVISTDSEAASTPEESPKTDEVATNADTVPEEKQSTDDVSPVESAVAKEDSGNTEDELAGKSIVEKIQPSVDISNQYLELSDNVPDQIGEVYQVDDNGGLPEGLEEEQYKVLQGILDRLSKGSQPDVDEAEYNSEGNDGFEVEERSYNVNLPNVFQELPGTREKALTIASETSKNTSEPGVEISTTESQISTDSLTSTTDSPTTTTNSPTSTTDSPTSTTDSPTSTTDSPTSTTDSPTSTTDSPTSTTDAKTSTTEIPTTSTLSTTVVTIITPSTIATTLASTTQAQELQYNRYGTVQFRKLPVPEPNALKLLQSSRFKKVGQITQDKPKQSLRSRPEKIQTTTPVTPRQINRKLFPTKRPRARVVVKTKTRDQLPTSTSTTTRPRSRSRSRLNKKVE